MKISIVIPAFNEERLLENSIREMRIASAAFLKRDWQTEIIVCDNNSTDQTAAVATAAGARVVFEPVNQISRARNRGATAASGEWLIFIDADSHPSEGLFEDVATQIESGVCLAGGSVIRMTTDRRLMRFMNGLWNWVSRLRRLMAGSFIFVDARVFRSLGGFSEELFVAEEIEFTYRLKPLAADQGKRIVILQRHPLTTSGRKVELYSVWELISFFLKSCILPGRMFRSREACHPWYDGRR